jgi:hypothetical protein
MALTKEMKVMDENGNGLLLLEEGPHFPLIFFLFALKFFLAK